MTKELIAMKHRPTRVSRKSAVWGQHTCGTQTAVRDLTLLFLLLFVYPMLFRQN